MRKRLDRIASTVENTIRITGTVFSWATLLLMISIVVQVVLRYVFNHDMVFLGELQWHFYAVMVMVSLSFAQNHDAHVRVDLFHSRFGEKAKRAIEVIGISVFLIPLIIVVFWYGWQFTGDAFRIGEKSASPGGLPWRWAIKAFIPIGAALLLLHSVARVVRLITGSAIVVEEGIAD